MKITCIKCPLGCEITIKDEKSKKPIITGNTCERGYKYAFEEITEPKRIVTSIILTKNGVYPCKTSTDISKKKVFDVLNEIKNLKIKKAKIGDVVIKNVCNTGANIVITGVPEI